MLGDPFHHLKPSLLRFSFDAVHLSVSKTRTILHDVPYIDPSLFTKACAKLDEKSKKVVKAIATLSIADQAYQHRIGEADSDMCPY
eukprot:9281613-Karenia_brevis.AAC.1